MLAQVSLGYFGAEESPDVDGAAAGWPGLPLRALDFDSNSGEFRLGAPALDALGRLGSCLTQLALSGGVLVETTPTGGSWIACAFNTCACAHAQCLYFNTLVIILLTAQSIDDISIVSSGMCAVGHCLQVQRHQHSAA